MTDQPVEPPASSATTQAGSADMQVNQDVGDEDILKEANSQFLIGKKHLLLQKYKSAVSCLEHATRLFDQIYGVSADECGDCYLQYGIALFELARMESGVFDGCVLPANGEGAVSDSDSENGAVDEEIGEEDEEEEEDESGAVADGDEAEEAQDERDGAAASTSPSVSGPSTAASSSSSTAQSHSTSLTAAPSEEPVAGSSKDDSLKGEAKEDEASDCDVAFEVLSLARDVFRRNIHKGSEMKLKLAESLQTLAEISLEWENFETASDLFQESLTLRKETLPAEDRLIAESYYHIGITFSFLNEIERANDCFRSAIQVVESKIAALESTPGEDNTREIAELQSLLPEMAAKIEDSKEQMNNSVEVAKVVADEESRESEVAAKIHDSPAKVVNNISHLVKRKRPASPPSNGTDGKKVCSNSGEGDVSETLT